MLCLMTICNFPAFVYDQTSFQMVQQTGHQYVNYTSPTHLHVFHWFPGDDTDDGAVQCVDMSIIHHQLTCTSSTGSRGMTPMMVLLSVLICQLYITY